MCDEEELLLDDLRDDVAGVRLPAGVMLAYVGDSAAMPGAGGRVRTLPVVPCSAPHQAGVADVLEKRDGHRDAVESVAVGRVLFEQRGDGDLGDVQRVLEQPLV